ncbi:hypothetical protein F2Q69_00014323 [Brassica cretica]|uniref:Uncharacterized protein n=1 Tax=Brassica cretica TaxID=69181 RepID=A0A8S9R790_BRACR|nr:hypothetical protein F2Q69_00014323 [Brassica cretica]
MGDTLVREEETENVGIEDPVLVSDSSSEEREDEEKENDGIEETSLPHPAEEETTYEAGDTNVPPPPVVDSLVPISTRVEDPTVAATKDPVVIRKRTARALYSALVVFRSRRRLGASFYLENKGLNLRVEGYFVCFLNDNRDIAMKWNDSVRVSPAGDTGAVGFDNSRAMIELMNSAAIGGTASGVGVGSAPGAPKSTKMEEVRNGMAKNVLFRSGLKGYKSDKKIQEPQDRRDSHSRCPSFVPLWALMSEAEYTGLNKALSKPGLATKPTKSIRLTGLGSVIRWALWRDVIHLLRSPHIYSLNISSSIVELLLLNGLQQGSDICTQGIGGTRSVSS